MIKRLRIKFICITMAIVTVMMTLLLYIQLDATQNSLMQRNMKALEDAAWMYRTDLPEEKSDDGPPAPGKPKQDKPKGEKPDFMKPEGEHPCFVLYLDASGQVTANGSGYYDLTDQQMLAEIYQRADSRENSTGVLWNYSLRYLRSGGVGDRMYAFTDITSEAETMEQMFRNSIIIWLLGFGAFLILSIFLANWAIRPVEQAWEQQRRFVADASHELKTPLTVILTNAELLREQAENEQQRKFSDSILTMSAQMRGLVESMLQLARADSGQSAAERERLDLSALLEQTVLPFEPMFYEAGLTLEIGIRPGICLSGNAGQLRRVAEILLDNALKYSAPGGTVRMELESRGHQCCLRVASPGAALTAQQCRDIFKRFYRVDTARSRNGSYGLGLSIAGQLVAAHRGRIWADSKVGVNTFYVNLPIN